MAKFTQHMVGKQVKLAPSLLNLSGEPHPHAGEEVTILERTGKTAYKVSTPDDTVIVVQDSDWGPTDAEMLKIISTPISAELAAQLQAINLYTDPTLNQAELIDLDLIDDSPSQPRTHYPDDYIAGLAASMKVVGMISPMLVRRKADGRYENVFGHCRKRGARAAGLKQGPAFVRDLTDAESAQLQAVENLQRKDLDAFDEAQSFAAYIQAHNVTKDEFCRRTGLSRTHVYNRLKLSTLHPDGQKALRAGRIRSEVATLIARVPGDKHQAHALKLVLENTTRDEDAPEEALMTVRKARDMLREKFTLGLKGALWALDDFTLVESAGACTVCPKRSGVDPVLYVDLLGKEQQWSRTPSGENVCTDPACFDAKKTAQLKVNQAELEAKGKTVIAGNKARQAVSAHGQLKGDYIALKDVKAELKKAGAKGTAQIETLTIQNPRDGKTIEVVKRQDLQAAGVKVEETGGGNGHEADRFRRLEDEKKLALENATYAETFRLVREAAANTARSTLDMQLIARVTWAGVEWDDKDDIAALYGVKDREIDERIDNMGPAELGLFMLDCALINNVKTNYIAYKPENLLTAAKHYGIDVAAVRKALAKTKDKPAKPAATEATPADEKQNEGEEVDA